MEYKIERIVANMKAHAIISKRIIASNGYTIFKSKDFGASWNECSSLPIPDYKKLVSRFKPSARLLRSGISQIKELSNSFILIGTNVGFFFSNSNLEFFEKINLQSRAFKLLDNSICVAPHYIYYGEYFPNFKHDQVNVYRSKDGLNWEKLYTFPKRTIRHIHLIQYDPFSNKLWFSTGDKDTECLMGFTDLDFSKIKLIGMGDQRWRMLEILFEKDKIFWGTENPNACNRIISLDRHTNQQCIFGRFNAPIYYLKKISCGYLALTPVEYGVGDIDKKAHVWFSDNLDSSNWDKILSYEKDKFPLVFGFGCLSFVGEIEDRLFFSAQCLKDVDNCTIILKRQR